MKNIPKSVAATPGELLPVDINYWQHLRSKGPGSLRDDHGITRGSRLLVRAFSAFPQRPTVSHPTPTARRLLPLPFGSPFPGSGDGEFLQPHPTPVPR